MALDLKSVRQREFPWTMRGDVIYMDHASTGPLPARASAALADYGARRAEPFRLRADDLFPVLQRARARAEALIHAPAGSVALVTNTSHGVNIAARALPYGAGDVVLIPPACRQRIANLGAGELVFLAICTPRFEQQNYEDVESSSPGAP